MQINQNLSDKWQSFSSIKSCYIKGHVFNIEEKNQLYITLRILKLG